MIPGTIDLEMRNNEIVSGGTLKVSYWMANSSPLSGFVRQVVVASDFDADAEMDAYLSTAVVPLLFRPASQGTLRRGNDSPRNQQGVSA